MDGPLHLVTGDLTGDAALDTAISRAILQRVTIGDLGETLQVGTPHRVAAFGKHDTLSDGFAEAVAIARDHGFDPTVRIAGGRAVVFDPRIIRFAWTMASPEPATDMHRRFRRLATAVVDALDAHGVDAAIGEIPNEYCAGEYSVHVLGTRKVMGVGQRLTRSAAQIGGMIVMDGAGDVNDVLVPVYEALGVPMDPAATGAVSDVAEVSTEDLTRAFVAEIAGDRAVVPSGIDPVTRGLATDLRDDHDPDLVIEARARRCA